MRKFIKKCIKFAKLTLIYWLRIILASSHFKLPFWKKLKANLGGGYLADQYVLYDFDHNDKKEYISEFDWYRSRYINEPFNKMLDNKVICTEVLSHYIKVPAIQLGKNGCHLIQYLPDVATYNDVVPLLKRVGKSFLKPISAGKGKGVHLLQYDNGIIYIDEKTVTASELIQFLKKMPDWIMTEIIKQCDFSNNLYDKTTNTIRFITMKDPKTQKMKVFFAVQRIGTSKTIPVDNGSRGGLVSKINLETGELGVARSLHALDVHEVHPDSKSPIKGAVIPNWTTIKAEVLELANQFPFMYFIAWDLLLTKDGVCVIEANTSSGPNIIQLWGGQRNAELGDFYRYHGIIK